MYQFDDIMTNTRLLTAKARSVEVANALSSLYNSIDIYLYESRLYLEPLQSSMLEQVNGLRIPHTR